MEKSPYVLPMVEGVQPREVLNYKVLLAASYPLSRYIVCVRGDLPIQIDHLLTCNNLCFAAKGYLGDRASVTSHCCLCSL